ncbi:hemolysin activation/secretion protein [Thioalkalivibrio sp. ALE21]|uniref:ShlB/FhaC/HecB family hemolysin secretion/activation protein n=1 Tax=Thioalkalivibrio sp. ALE21 TaxID=1158175 RepID=UPI000D9D14C7|nr:ShlB/FhaC/HecB family hemolysin secretion/activation protein [Thioalkalivibrio sp. ALE21]PYG02696.1 hemolysin activation/secretion protein [Thioalkalivibrio sp. ALE21]
MHAAAFFAGTERVSSLSRALLLLLLGISLCVPVHAQVEPDAGTLLRDRPEVPREPERMPEREALPEPMEETDVRIELERVVFEGYESLAEEPELQALVADRLGEELGFNGLQQLAERVTRHLREQGYILSFAYLPEQDVSDGEVVIRIRTGALEDAGSWEHILEDKDVRLSDERVVGMLNHQLSPEQEALVQAAQLERTMLLFNDLAGIRASSSLRAGREPGTTRMDIDFREEDRYTGTLWADNYGNRYTGEERLNARGAIHNLSGRGDRLTGMVSAARWMTNLDVQYTTPLGYSGLSGHLELGYLDYELGRELSDLDYEGDALTAGAGLSYPLIRSRLRNLSLEGSYQYRELDDEQAGDNVRDRVYHTGTVALDGDWLDEVGGGGLVNYRVAATVGDLDRSGNAFDRELDRQTARTHGSFRKLNLEALRLQRITDDFSLLVRASGQYSFDNLDSAEQFSAGGPHGVRAYPAGEISGDHGWQATVEGRYDAATLDGIDSRLQLTAFYDAGGVTLRRDRWDGYSPANANETNTPVIQGAGVGANLHRPGVYSLRASVAFKVNDDVDDRSVTGKDSDGRSRDPRFWVQAMVWF